MSSIDTSALVRIGYGLYVVTCRDGEKDNGLIVNTVCQVTNTPNRVAVTINKHNYSHDVIRSTGLLNVNCLTNSAPFALFQHFGFRSGRDTDKFGGQVPQRAANGLAALTDHVNAVICLRVEQYIDLDTHGMFICTVTEAWAVSDEPSMTYAYYHANVKPKPTAQKKKGFVCKICGWVYEGEELPPDLVCPICKHPASDFEPIS